jgi:hypothetical protein
MVISVAACRGGVVAPRGSGTRPYNRKKRNMRHATCSGLNGQIKQLATAKTRYPLSVMYWR